MKRRRWTSAALVVAMAGSLLSACSGNSASAPDSNSPDGKKGEVPNLEKSGMPIVKQPVSLTFFTGKAATNGNNFEETTVWKEYAKLSNVNVKFQLVPFDNLTEKRNLALAGGDYPDAFILAAYLRRI